jgi:hypothetical protein
MVPTLGAKKCKQAGINSGTVFNGDPVAASGFPIRKDPAGNRYWVDRFDCGAARTG